MDFWRLLGYSKATFYSSKIPLDLLEKDGEKTSLQDLCKMITPPCWLNMFLFNGNIQTAWTIVKGKDPLVYYKRKIFTAECPAYEGSFAVDFVVSPYIETDVTLPPRTSDFSDDELRHLGSDDYKPMLVTMHGLAGGSQEVYLRHLLFALYEKGWEACVVNARGCAQSKVTSGILFNARATWDIRQLVKWLRERFPNRPLFAVGYSLGACILVNYLGEEGDRCLLDAAAVCSNPWNLDVSNTALQRTWLGLEAYSKSMARNLKGLFELHIEHISKNPRIDVDAVRRAKYLHEFDRELQCPTWGYPTEGAYYRDASSCDSLLAVRIPLFALHAQDDPIAAAEAVPYQEFQQTPYAVLCMTKLGGHLGWFESGGGRWFAKTAAQFFEAMAERVDLSRLQAERQERLRQEEGELPSGGLSFDPMRRNMGAEIP